MQNAFVKQSGFALRWVFALGLLGWGLCVLPGTAQTNFAVLAPDGAWCWYSDPRALFHNGKLYFGYVRAADGRTVLSVFDLATGTRTDLWVSSLVQCDDHNVPGVLVKQNGRLLAVYTRHGTDRFFMYRYSLGNDPATPGDWSPEFTSADTGAGITYANPFQLAAEAGRIYNFARNLNYNPTVFVSTNGGSNWSTPQLVIRTGSGGTRPYVKYCSDYDSRIDLLYTDGHPRDVANSLYHIYYKNGAFYRTDGSLLKYYTNLPILHDSGERGSVIYQYSDAPQSDPNQWIPTGRAWCWEIAYAGDGRPVCVFSVQRDNVTGTNWYDDRIYYYYARWTGSNWIKRFIAHAGRPLYAAEDDYAGGICLDPMDPNVVYISSNAEDPFNLSDTTNVPLRANQRYELWRGVTTNGGLSFQWQQITSNSPVDNLRPYVPRRTGGEPCVLWFRGTYTSYTAFNCSVVGLFTTRVPQQEQLSSGVWIRNGSGNWDDPENWLNGVIASGSGNTADFSTLDITADCSVALNTNRTIGVLKFGDLAGNENWVLYGPAQAQLVLAGPAPAITVNQNTTTVAVPLAGTNGFTKSGAGTLVLAQSNPISGPVYLDTAKTTGSDGVIRLAHPHALSCITAVALRNNNSGSSTLELDGTVAGGIRLACPLSIACRNNDVPAIRNLGGTNELAGFVSLDVGGNRVVFQADAGTLVLSGGTRYVGSLANARSYVFTGPGDFLVSGPILNSTNGAQINLVKLGPGRLTLAAPCAYTGTTTISNGTVCLENAALASGQVVVASGTLTGAGSITGSVTVLANGILAPGLPNAVGALYVIGSVTNLGKVLVRIARQAGVITNDAIRSGSMIVYGGQLCVSNLTPGVVTAGDRFKLFDAPAYAGTFAQLVPSSPGPGLVWDTTRLAVDGTLGVRLGDVSPRISATVSEEGSIIITGAGGAAGAGFSVLASTSPVVPVAEWTLVATGTMDPAGCFAFTNTVLDEFPSRFFLIRIP